jgi:DNA-binding response OmpR family regulator
MENQAVKPPMVLIVESDPLMLTGLAAILDKKGYRCFLARTVEIAEQATQSIAFDLIVYSFATDPIEAAQAVAKLRTTEQMLDCPVLFLADAYDSKWIEPLNLAGGVYCLPKPFEPELFLELVDKTFCLPHLAAAKVAPPKPHFAKDWVRLSY